VEVREWSRGASIGAGWSPANVGNAHTMERFDPPANPLAALRAREAHLTTLLARAGAGDQAALADLYDGTHVLVYSLALRILHDQAAAEDVTIEVYTQVHRRAADYDPQRGTPSAWLLTLARNRAIDRLRMERNRRAREEGLDEASVVATPGADPEDFSTAMELRHIVQRALATLTPEQREVIEIAYYTGLSHSEIAAKLGQPLGTIKTRIRTGMRLLREQLRPIMAEIQP
jgi:RNA polymerase sigma-70 factor (ECF subfamily)